jgi:hypothetical protein
MEIVNIERFFLNTLLRISLGGVLLILLSDVYFYAEDTRSIIIDIIVLAAGTIAYLLRKRNSVVAVLTLTSIVLASMVYQCLLVPMSTTNSLSIILLVGFIHAVMLKGQLLWIVQVMTLAVVNGVFIMQFIHPGMVYTNDRNEMITITITYSIIFIILTYATAILKASYDRINQTLRESVAELNTKATEIAAQNEELMQIQEKLNVLNVNLEGEVNERTTKIKQQNEILLKYSYTNAHHLRGPVARLLGLANVYRLEATTDPEFIIGKMEEQAKEIDEVIRKINEDLETGHQPGEDIIAVK